MDISPDLKTQKIKLEHGSEKSSPGNIGQKTSDSVLTESTIEVDGKLYQMPDDLNDLEEIDYSDRGVENWLGKEKAESIQKYGKITPEEAEYMFTRRLELEKELPNKSVEDLNKMALAEFNKVKTKRKDM